MNAGPDEYLYDGYFERVRRRFQICGTRPDKNGVKLVLKCLGCGQDLHYPWLTKSHDQEWVGEFGDRVKNRLSANRSHRKCITRNETEIQTLRAENERLLNHITTTASPTIQQQNNIVIVNLPAVTRIGTAGEPIMCSDIPYPDEKTVRALLNNPEKAVPEFVYRQYFTAKNPSITAPDATNTKLKLVQRDKHGNHWVDASLETTVDDIVYKTLDTLDDTFEAMECNLEYKDWKRREGLTAHTGFDRTEAYQKLQSDVKDVLKSHGRPYH